MSTLPDGAYLAALAGVRPLGPRRLRRLLTHHEPADAHAALMGEAPLAPALATSFTPVVLDACRHELATRDPAVCWAGCADVGIDVVALGDDRYPAVLVHDPFPPAVLFLRGDPAALAVRRVGVVGTRNATRQGLDIAAELGHDLAALGAAVVSGLALGIDGAAHRGALRAGVGPPIAVVGNGLDQPYPRSHRELWAAVGEEGLLVSEWPPGTPPEAFRFPLRNRILAALCEVLVVVESRERGGSLGTVHEALLRGVEVMAVPGSPRSRASSGTNTLLRDGAAPVTSADDVAIALGLDTSRVGTGPVDLRPLPTGLAADLLDRCRGDAATLDELVLATGEPLARVAMALARLERDGWLAESGGWFEPRRSRGER